MMYLASTMSKTDYAKCSNFYVITFLILFIHFCTSAPINLTENAYAQFVAELNHNKCSVPTQVQLPFDTSKANNFEYLSPYLEICQKTESTKRNKEAVVLCKEIFDNIKSISCPMKTALPDISVNLSEKVCPDISALKDSVPEDDKSLLKRLTDGFLCDIMCDSEFEKACQVLLWSFEVRKQIASVASVREPEQPNMPEDRGDENEDNFKQGNTVDGEGLPEIGVNPENEKKNVEKAKDGKEAVGHNGIAEVPEPNKLEDNPEPKPDISFIPSGKVKLEKTVPNDEGENQAVPKAKSQDSTGATKSTISTKTPSSVAQQKPGAQASNTDAKPVEETAEGESNDRNANKQLPVDTTKHDEVNAGGELPQGSNSGIATHEETQDVKANTLSDSAVQERKDANEHPPDNTINPASKDIPVNVEGDIPDNEIPDETPEKGNQDSDFPNNDLPHRSANEKSPNDAAADLLPNEQTPSNLVDTLAGNKPQSTANNDNQSSKKSDAPTASSQTTKDATQQQIVQEAARDKTSLVREENKSDQHQTNSASRKVETQDHTKTDAIPHVLVVDDGNGNPSANQKETKVAQQTKEFDNTIPDVTEEPIITGEKPIEKSQKSRPTAANPDGKSVVPSSLAETSTKTTAALENMEGGSDLRRPADEEADHYGDLENTGDDEYSRPEYGDGGLFEVTKNKASNPDVPSPINSAKGIITSQNEKPMDFPSRNEFGRDSSDIQMISAFPEQEDGHFFFYFLSIVLILMAGYLIFHNKQKIIALIVEGRHERNRRSHRVGYKKLETK